MDGNKLYWAEKYRPDTLDEYVLHPDIKQYFEAMVKNRSYQNCLFEGQAGCGKTTLAKILAKEFNAETLFVKCATDGTLDVLRTRIQEFCNAMPFDGRPKVVILDELDSASSGSTNNFQLGLRTTIEGAAADTIFICTCNYVSKIIPAVLSRCPVIPLRFDKKDLLQRVKYVLDSEKVKYDRESLKAFIEESFHYYPDVRRIINYLQLCSNSGMLTVKLGKVVDSEKGEFLNGVMEKTLSEQNLLDVRQFYLKNKDKISDFVAFGSDVYNYAVDNDIVTEDGVLKLTDQLYMLNTVIDKEAGLFGMLAAVRKYRKL